MPYCVYVGSTAHTPEERFRQHLAGYKANKYAKRYGVRLKPRLYSKYLDLETRALAEQEEVKLAERLRKRGYAVWRG